MQRVDSGSVIDAKRQPDAVALTLSRQAGADLVSVEAAPPFRPERLQSVTSSHNSGSRTRKTGIGTKSFCAIATLIKHLMKQGRRLIAAGLVLKAVQGPSNKNA
ncbi:hypothetical protein JOS77_20020 [Chromobacterium haemolyticum]|nr:hypothetical protein JOS77_20020 [Chromobacterium haemolyticum]